MSLRDDQFFHKCELTRTRDDNFELRYSRLRRNFIKIYSVNPNLGVTQHYLKSKALIREEKKRHVTQFWMTIHPFSSLTLIWDSFMIIVLTIAYFRLPFMFFDYLKYYRSSIDDLNILFVTNCFYLMDIVFRLFQGTVKEDENVSKIELHLGRCFLLYLKGTLIFDVLSTIPFLIIRFCDTPDSNDLLQTTFRFMALLKLFRIYDYQNYLRRFLEYINVNDNKSDMILFFVSTFTVFHQFVGLQLLPGIIAIKFFNFEPQNFWYEDKNFRDRTLLSQFIVCKYRAISTLFGTGFMDFQPRNVFDKAFLTFMMVFGCFTRCVLFVKLLVKLKCMQYHRYKYEEIMNQIHKYVRHKKLPTKIHEKFRKFYDFHYRGSYFPEEKVESCVSEQLKQDILMHNTRVLTEKVSFLANLPSTVFQTIVSCLHREVVLEGEVIASCGEVGDAMYFIASGTLVLLSPSGIELGHVSDGSFFGAATLVLENERRTITCVALETCELYRLDREDFNRVILPNSALLQEIERTAIERYDHMRFVEQQFRRRTSTPEPFEVFSMPSDTEYEGLIRSPWASTSHNRHSTIAGSGTK
ncbi:potassium/sodium hyperpolarization-activated cyclic nucleotide-gated channel 1-like [Culicoides brevitarsis]|uniref:potassium/sodium hyperpolarization-activated cyclic nucleotide-gated channel 1-like n=1 Tax=Culicoides brevitarsis TaxID=469753 RepID=UPI00307C3830